MISPYIAEFVGTAILLLLGSGIVANISLSKTKGTVSGASPSNPKMIAFGEPWPAPVAPSEPNSSVVTR